MTVKWKDNLLYCLLFNLHLTSHEKLHCAEMYPEMHAITKMAKIRQNRQFRQDDFALTNLTKNHQNRQIHEHWLGLTIEKWRVALVSAKLNCQRAWLDRERYRFFCFLDSGVRKNRSQQLGNLTICSEVIVKRPAKGVGGGGEERGYANDLVVALMPCSANW